MRFTLFLKAVPLNSQWLYVPPYKYNLILKERKKKYLLGVGPIRVKFYL